MPDPVSNIADALARHPDFEPWIDPQSGVRSWILNRRVAPSQAVIYFVNSAISADGKWLWFSAGFPPSPYKRLAVASLDPDRPLVRVFEQATFHSESPLIAPGGDACYFAEGASVYLQPIDGEAKEVLRVPDSFLKGRRLRRVATHLTMSADGRYLLLDGAFESAYWFVAIGDLVTGEVRVLKQWTRHMNHAQFSPVEPKLFSIAQDHWHDPITGQWFPFDHRIWLMDIDGRRFEPLRPSDWFQHGTEACHEWWDARGRVCWVDYRNGVHRCDLSAGSCEHVWRRPLCHAHCDVTCRYWVGDQNPYRWETEPCEVAFMSGETSREVSIVTAMPKPPLPRHPLHLDPHPHFSPRGDLVAYMTTVRGTVDVAVTAVSELVARTA